MSSPIHRAEILIRGGIAVCILSVCSASGAEYFLRDRTLAIGSVLAGLLFGAWMIQKGNAIRKTL